MPKTVTIRINDDTYDSFMKRARVENRSLSNFIETTVKQHIRECDFVDVPEMAEILASDRLVEHLRKGSKDAKRKKGKLIG